MKSLTPKASFTRQPATVSLRSYRPPRVLLLVTLKLVFGVFVLERDQPGFHWRSLRCHFEVLASFLKLHECLFAKLYELV